MPAPIHDASGSEPSAVANARSNWTVRSAIRLAVGLVAFGAVLWLVVPSWEALLGEFRVAPGWLAAAFAGTALAHLAVASRWKLLSEAMGGTSLPYSAYFHSLVVTRFLGQFVPALTMDLLGRGVALRSQGSKRGLGHAATLVAFERVLDVILPVALILWAFGVRRYGLESQAAALLAAGSVAFVFLATPGLRPSARVALRLYSAVSRSDLDELPSVVTTAIAFQVAVLSVIRFGAVLIQFGAIGAGIGLVLPWLDWTAATPIAQLTGMLGITPGGLGVVEAGWWAGLAWIGVAGASVGPFLLAQRAALVSFLGALALTSSGYRRWVARRPVRESF